MIDNRMPSSARHAPRAFPKPFRPSFQLRIAVYHMNTRLPTQKRKSGFPSLVILPRLLASRAEAFSGMSLTQRQTNRFP
jgi:hypothetical protein